MVSSEELRDTENMVQKVETEFQSVMKFFAEDGKLQPEDFFGIFKTFSTLFEVCCNIWSLHIFQYLIAWIECQDWDLQPTWYRQEGCQERSRQKG